MAQHISHGLEAGSLLHQVAGQSVTQQVRSGARHHNAATPQRALDNLRDGLAVHGPRWLLPDKDLPVRANRPPGVQVVGDSLSDFARQRQLRRKALPSPPSEAAIIMWSCRPTKGAIYGRLSFQLHIISMST